MGLRNGLGVQGPLRGPDRAGGGRSQLAPRSAHALAAGDARHRPRRARPGLGSRDRHGPVRLPRRLLRQDRRVGRGSVRAGARDGAAAPERRPGRVPDRAQRDGRRAVPARGADERRALPAVRGRRHPRRDAEARRLAGPRRRGHDRPGRQPAADPVEAPEPRRARRRRGVVRRERRARLRRDRHVLVVEPSATARPPSAPPRRTPSPRRGSPPSP